MNDFKGNELAIGDTVIFTYDGGGNMKEGKIIKIMPKGIRVKYGETTSHSYQYQGKTHTYTTKNESNLINCQNRVLKIG